MPHLKELFSESSPLDGGGHADILLAKSTADSESYTQAEYDLLSEADRSHLVRKVITNVKGRKQVVWVNPAGGDGPQEKSGGGEYGLKTIPISSLSFPGGLSDEVTPLKSNADEPIIVRRDGDKYRIVDGFGRASGLKNAGESRVLAIIVSSDDLAENKSGEGDEPEWVGAIHHKYAPHSKLAISRDEWRDRERSRMADLERRRRDEEEEASRAKAAADDAARRYAETPASELTGKDLIRKARELGVAHSPADAERVWMYNDEDATRRIQKAVHYYLRARESYTQAEYDLLSEADRSHLVRKVITNVKGRKQVVWVRAYGDERDAGTKTRQQVADARTLVALAVADPNRLNPEQFKALAEHLETVNRDDIRNLLKQVGEKVGGDKVELANRLVEKLKAGRTGGVGDALAKAPEYTEPVNAVGDTDSTKRMDDAVQRGERAIRMTPTNDQVSAVTSAIPEPDASGLVPIWQVRQAVRKSRPDITPEQFDSVILAMRRDREGPYSVVSIDDRSRATTDQLVDGVHAVGEQFFYLQPRKKK